MRDDARAVHFVAFVGERVVGTSRVVLLHESARIGRMAVLRRYRAMGIGKMLLQANVRFIRATGARLGSSSRPGPRDRLLREAGVSLHGPGLHGGWDSSS